MKVLIDIPEDYLNDIRKERQTTLWRYAIANGKALSYMTNGDMIEAMFPNCEQKEHMNNGYFEMYFDNDLGNASYVRISKEWWRAPYSKEGEKDNE